MADLTTLAGVKRQLRISDSNSDTLLDELIDAMSARFERIVGRTITAANYYEWISGIGQRRVKLKNWPVIRTYRIASGNGHAMDVEYTGAGIEASIAVTTTELRLTSLSAAGVETSTQLTFATYPTVSTLVTAIDAVSGWNATLVNDSRAQYLHPIAGRDVKNTTVQLTYADTADHSVRVDEATGLLGFDTIAAYDGYDYTVNSSMRNGSLETTRQPPSGHRNILVYYRAGYETIPADIDQVVREMVQGAFQMGQTNLGGLQSESLGDYSYTLAEQVNLTDRQMSMVSHYMTPVVG